MLKGSQKIDKQSEDSPALRAVPKPVALEKSNTNRAKHIALWRSYSTQEVH